MKVVIKIGGSLCIDQNGPRYSYISKLVPILRHVMADNQVIIAIGGGLFVRRYYKIFEKYRLSSDQIEWLGIDLLRMNARFLAYLLGTKPIYSLDEVGGRAHGVISGIVPGRSTDANAALAAAKIRADLLVKLTNVDGIYDKDPNKFKSAKYLRRVPFSDLKKYSTDGRPGSYGILDYIAMDTIVKNKIRTVVMSGKSPQKLEDLLKGEKIGTLIS